MAIAESRHDDDVFDDWPDHAEIIIGISSGRSDFESHTDTYLGRIAARLSDEDGMVRPIICDPIFFKALPSVAKTEDEEDSGILHAPVHAREVGRDHLHSRRASVQSALLGALEVIDTQAQYGYVVSRQILVAAREEAPWIARQGARIGLDLTLPDNETLPRNNDLSVFGRWARVADDIMGLLEIRRHSH